MHTSLLTESLRKQSAPIEIQMTGFGSPISQASTRQSTRTNSAAGSPRTGATGQAFSQVAGSISSMTLTQIRDMRHRLHKPSEADKKEAMEQYRQGDVALEQENNPHKALEKYLRAVNSNPGIALYWRQVAIALKATSDQATPQKPAITSVNVSGRRFNLEQCRMMAFPLDLMESQMNETRASIGLQSLKRQSSSAQQVFNPDWRPE